MARGKRKGAPAKTERTYYDCCFDDYTGTKRFVVTHPAHRGELRVAAPDEASAIVAAANRWGEAWTQYRFYAYCNVYVG